MKYRALGSTGVLVSELGFGCGSVGGLLVRGDYAAMLRTVARAIELGVTYFDTARIYGDGQSEANLGEVLGELRADVVVGTKVQLRPEEMGHIERGVFDSVDGSLQRLQRERVDLIQLHNRLGPHTVPEKGIVGVDELAVAIEAFSTLRDRGMVRFWGINGLGETDALHRALAESGAHTMQCCYNLLNPSARMRVQEGFPFQDYGQLIDRAATEGVGVIAIRVLAAGALSGSKARHPNAAPSVAPIATGRDYAEDVELASRFRFLVDAGHVENLVEAAIRFALSKTEISTALVGISDLSQLEQAVVCAEKGPLPAHVLARLGEVWTGFGQESPTKH